MFKRALCFVLCLIVAFSAYGGTVGLAEENSWNGAITQEYTKPDGPLKDWDNAEWIWADAETGNNTHADFRRVFTIEEVPEKVTVKIACDNKYWMYLNGQSVTVEGGLTRGPNEYDTYYDVLDVSPYLVQGENIMEILVWYWGNTGMMTHYISSGVPGLLVYTDFGVLTGDGEWFARLDPAFASGGERENFYLGEYPEVYDARLENDDGWSLAVPAKEEAYAGAEPWGNLIERPIPQFRDFGLTEKSLSEAEADKGENGVTVYRLTLPYNMQVFPYIKFAGETEAGSSVVMYTETVGNSGLTSTYYTKDGEQEYESRLWMNGDFLYFSVSDKAEVETLGYRQTGYNITNGEATRYLGFFDSCLNADDYTVTLFNGGHSWDKGNADYNFYDELWQKAADTLYVSLRDGYMDCPDRERGQYIGDVLNELEEAFYVLGPEANAVTAKAIHQICEGQIAYEYDGKTFYSMSCLEPFPSTHEIQVQELGCAVAAYKYWLYTGDASLPADTWQALYNYLTNFGFITGRNYTGTIRVRPDKELLQTAMIKGGSLGGWTDWGNNQDSRIAFSCWWYMSAKAVLEMAEAEGVSASAEQIAWLKDNMKKVEENFEVFWNEELHAYATRFDSHWYKGKENAAKTHLVDDRVNALAVVSGLADPAHYEDIRNVFMGTESSPAYENASIYMERYVIEALYTMGYADDAMTRLAERHIEIVNDKDSSTLPELWEYSAGMNSTKNHGWSGGGLIAMSRFAAGIEPTGIGYSAYRIRPQLGRFEAITLAVPSQIGEIRETIEKTDEGFRLQVAIPQGNCEIWVPVEDGQVVSGTEAKEIRREDGYFIFLAENAGTYEFTAG